MYSLKFAHLVNEKTGAEVYNFYIDMRCFGKGYEEFYNRLLEEGVRVHPRPRRRGHRLGRSTPMEKGKLVIRVEDTLLGLVRRIPVDMVVLCTGLEAGRRRRRGRAGCSTCRCSSDGFFLEQHPKLAPVSTSTDGVFIAGALPGAEGHPRHRGPGLRRGRARRCP